MPPTRSLTNPPVSTPENLNVILHSPRPSWRRGSRTVLVLGALLAFIPSAPAQGDAGWTGNMARNPGFEEDFVNVRGESHVLSFKGDWYYNQKDLIPDYWDLK